ncbi:MAG TPA: hypothetical protein VM282_19590 [Acidimicrobiales bacterium]|nr:hypothetical protein [Acidimicrobiales bacterium]
MPRRLPRLVAISTTSLLFFGGVAAAATGTNALSPLLGADENAALPTTTTTTTLPTSDASADTEGGQDDALTFEEICAAAANHGEAVSTVAMDDSTVGAEHGAAVSEMAQSDCGKTDDEDVTELQSEEPESEPADDHLTFEEICAAATNHGAAVSAVAKGKSTVGAAHGAAVSEMAESDCGKTDDASDDHDDEEPTGQQAARRAGK